jgi:hypothetical protein
MRFAAAVYALMKTVWKHPKGPWPGLSGSLYIRVRRSLTVFVDPAMGVENAIETALA